jgi:nitrogenase cofactor biosynthesis protein NifB
MCMPMGVAMAIKGIEGSMTILHGSQGCATYIRRHMAGHFHEPVDIASTSLSEEGAVYGGERNLKAGIANVTQLYTPSLIAVSSTCLAETIGEDIRRMTAEVEREWSSGDTMAPPVLVPVASPGYGGSQEEGWFAALRALVERLAGTSDLPAQADELPFVNVILPPLNPGDVRGVRRLLDALGVRHVMLPDVSETLDAPWRADWDRVSTEGTTIRDMRRMHLAWCTIELAELVPERLSPGAWLETHHGVPLVRMGLPIGVGATDHFVEELSVFAGKPVPDWLDRERGRLLDALVDSHKHLAEAHACVTGAPEFCLAVSRLLAESGVHVMAVATGSVCERFGTVLREQLQRVGADPEESPLLLVDTDYRKLLQSLSQRKVNLLVGSSDARFLERRLGVPLLRHGFPVHDRMGGQRVSLIGYDGALQLLDPVANVMLERRHKTFRAVAKQYLLPRKPVREIPPILQEKPMLAWMSQAGGMPEPLAARTRQHPCYTPGACANARVHLPIAPACNIACNYCNRKYDCVNESRPGVTSLVLTPETAIRKYAELREKVPNLQVVGIAGPGDALANFTQTAQTLRGIREMDPDVTFCLSTNGLLLPFRAFELALLGVTHLTVTVNAVDPVVGAAIYRKVTDQGKVLTGEEGAALLLERQSKGIRMAASLGMVVKVNTVLVPGVNDRHIPEVVRAVKSWGASLSNIMPLIPAEGSVFAKLPAVSRKNVDRLREICSTDLPQMTHCRQCRADAVGRLDEDRSLELMAGMTEQGKPPDHPAMPTSLSNERNKVRGGELSTPWLAAVATSDGCRVDRHFGQVETFFMYRVVGTEVTFWGKRELGRYCMGPDCSDETDARGMDDKPEMPGSDSESKTYEPHDRTLRAVEALQDCRMVLALRVGPTPAAALEAAGIRVALSCDFVETALLEATGYVVAAGEEKKHA